MGQLIEAACAGAVFLAAWAISRSIGGADGILGGVNIAVKLIGFVAWWVVLARVLGAIFGTRFEVDMAEGD